MAFRSLATLALVPLFAVTAAAQTDAAMARPKNVLSTQPVFIIFGLYSAEYERALSSTTTISLGASYLSDILLDDGGPDVNYASAEVKVRYYPGARPFEGFSFAGSVGASSLSEKHEGVERDATGPSIGTFLDYSWRLGPTKRFYASLGVGAKVVFVDEDELLDFNPRYPTGRMAVGFAF